jgi:hypothetical protein
MYIFGGYDGSRYNDTHRLNLDALEWSGELSTEGTKPTDRSAHTAVVYGNYMYIFGGYDGSNYNDTHELTLVVPVTPQLIPATNYTIQQNTNTWNNLRSITTVASSTTSNLYHALSFDGRENWKVYNDGWRTIATLSGAQWYYRDNADSWLLPSGNQAGIALSAAWAYNQNKLTTSGLAALNSTQFAAAGGFNTNTQTIDFAFGIDAATDVELYGYEITYDTGSISQTEIIPNAEAITCGSGITVTSGSLTTDITTYATIMSVSGTYTLPADSQIYTAISLDERDTWKIWRGSEWYDIVTISGGNWYYRDGGSWTAASGNTMCSGLADAMTVTDNQLDIATFNALGNYEWDSIIGASTLDFAIVLTTSGAEFPTFEKWTINYAVGLTELTLVTDTVNLTKKDPTAAYVFLDVQAPETYTLDTDLKAWVSTDDGTNYTQISGLELIYSVNNHDYVQGTISGLTTYDSAAARVKVTTYNAKDLRFLGFAYGFHLNTPAEYLTFTEFTTYSGDIIAQIPAVDAYATQTWVSGNYLSQTDFTTYSGDIVAQIPSDYVSDSEFTTYSGDIVDQIPTDYVSDVEMTTISGDIIAQIPSDYVSDSEFTTYSGDIIAQIPADYVSDAEMTTISGDIVDQIPSLAGYAIETWVSDNYINNTEMTTISGDIVAQISSVSGYATETWVSDNYIDHSEFTTYSGDIIAQIPSLAGYATQTWVSGNYIDNAKIVTISGDIVDQIPSLAGYATETWVGNNYVSHSEFTTYSGDLVDQIPTDYVSDAEMTTISGDIVDQIPVDYISDTEMTTISGDIISQIPTLLGTGGVDTSLSGTVWTIDGTNISGAGDVTTKQLTTTSGDIVSWVTENYVSETNFTTYSGDIVAQIPTDYISDTEMVTISGDIVAQIPSDYVSDSEFTTYSGDIVAQIPADYISDTEMTTISGDIVDQIPNIPNSTAVEQILISDGAGGWSATTSGVFTAASGTFTDGLTVGTGTLHVRGDKIIFPNDSELRETTHLYITD